MKIPTYYWVAYTIFNLAVSYLASDRSQLSIAKALEQAVGISIALLLILIIIWVFSKAFRIKAGHLAFKRLFVFFGVILTVVVVGRSFRQWNLHKADRYVKECVENLEKERSENSNLKQYDLEAYCRCAMEQSADIPLEDSALYSDPKSTAFIDKFGKCWESALIPKRVLGVDAGMMPDSIELINLYSNIQVKVKVNGKSIYMILDSGASDVLIGEDELKDQIEAGEVTFTGEETVYELADGSTIKAKQAKVKEFTIGEFSLIDLEIAIAKDVATPLLGKSVLEQFTSWTVYNKNVLILHP